MSDVEAALVAAGLGAGASGLAAAAAKGPPLEVARLSASAAAAAATLAATWMRVGGASAPSLIDEAQRGARLLARVENASKALPSTEPRQRTVDASAASRLIVANLPPRAERKAVAAASVAAAEVTSKTVGRKRTRTAASDDLGDPGKDASGSADAKASTSIDADDEPAPAAESWAEQRRLQKTAAASTVRQSGVRIGPGNAHKMVHLNWREEYAAKFKTVAP